MPRVVHFDITADEPRRAAAFYSEVFGWKIAKSDGDGDLWSVVTGSANEPGINGTLVQRQAAHERVIHYVGVASLDEFLPRIAELGGEIVKERTAIPGVGYTALCLDPEDNLFGLFEADENAE